jgi:hypothetical protein
MDTPKIAPAFSAFSPSMDTPKIAPAFSAFSPSMDIKKAASLRLGKDNR